MAKTDLVRRRTIAVTPDTYERLSKVAAEMQLRQPGNVSLTMALAALLDLWDAEKRIEPVILSDYIKKIKENEEV